MGEGFRIAEGFVQVTVRPDREQLRAAAQEAASEFESGAQGRFHSAGEHAGHDFASGARTSIGRDLEAAMGEAANRTGTNYVMAVDRVLRNAGSHFKRTGEELGHDLVDGLGGGSSSSGAVGPLSGLLARITSQFRDVQQIGRDAFADIKKGADNVGDAFGGVSKAASVAFTALKWVGGPIAALELIPPTLYAIGGALASIPALAVGAGAALAALGLGTQGVGAAIGEVFNPRTGGGGAARIDQVASAERRLATAQREAQQAQQDLNTARRQAAFDLTDLNLQLERQQENEASAALAIVEAQEALLRAQASGDPLAVARAQLALREAVTGLKEAKQRTVELKAEKADADAKGVEGSDKVRAAQDRITNALNAVKDAQDAVRQASISAGAAAVTAYSKLSPEAKKFIDEIRRLRPELIGVQQYVQDRLFAGLDRKLDVWAHVWIPAARRDLGLLADDGNRFASRLGDDLSKPAFIAAVDHVVGMFDRLFDRFTQGGTLDKLVEGFGALVDKASPFIEQLGSAAIDKLGNAADSLNRAAKDGALERFFKEAAKDAKDLWHIGQDVFDIVSQIIGAVFHEDTSKRGENALDRLRDTFDHIRDWARSDEGKRLIQGTIDWLIDIGHMVEWVVGHLVRFAGWWSNAYHQGHENLHRLSDDLDSFTRGASRMWHEFTGGVVNALKMVLDRAADAFGWIPDLGPKLTGARRNFDAFVDGYNRDVDRMQSHKTLTIDVVAPDLKKMINDPNNFGNPNRWGGVYHAQDGLMSLGRGSAGIYSGGPLYAFAEPDTGGEIFIPKHGEQRRNQALTTVAMQWSGMDVVPARGSPATGTGGTTTATAAPAHYGPYIIQIGSETVATLLIDAMTGNPVAVSRAAAVGDRLRGFVNSPRK